MRITKIIDFSHYDKLKKKVGLALVILIIALIIFTGYFLLFYAKPCKDRSGTCFVEAMRNCKAVSWVREDDQAAWIYTIKGDDEKDACKVEIKLLEIKKGTIDSEKLEGKKMLCTVQKGSTKFPEKDISKCTGILKEEIQDLIIQRMHNYLLENIGEIKQEFSGI